MIAIISLSGFCYLLYLYNYDKVRFNRVYNCLPNFRNISNENNRSNENNNGNENNNIEIKISDDEYDMSDHPPDKNNPVDYYDNSLSTEFIETIPIINRFYNFSKKNDNDKIQNV